MLKLDVVAELETMIAAEGKHPLRGTRGTESKRRHDRAAQR